MSYYTKITTAGLAAITAAMNNNSKVPITYMAFGDGNGFIPEPNENSTALVNEVYRVGVNKVEVHSKNPNWLVCEAIIPSAVGGFNIREVALYDSTGNTMLAVASYPPTYKPTVEEGAAKIQTIRIVIQVDNSGNFELIVDPDVVLATVEYVNSIKKDTEIKTWSGLTQDKKNKETISIFDFGGICDGTLHKAQEWLDSGRFNSFAQLKDAYPSAVSVDDSIDNLAMEKALANVGMSGHVRIGGRPVFNREVLIREDINGLRIFSNSLLTAKFVHNGDGFKYIGRNENFGGLIFENILAVGPNVSYPQAGYVPTSTGAGFYMKNAFDITLINSSATNFNKGYYLEHGFNNKTIGYCRFMFNQIGVNFVGMANVNKFENVKVRENRVAGVVIDGMAVVHPSHGAVYPTKNKFSGYIESNVPYLGGYLPPSSNGSDSVGVKLIRAYENDFSEIYMENQEFDVILENQASYNSFSNTRHAPLGGRKAKIWFKGMAVNCNTFQNAHMIGDNQTDTHVISDHAEQYGNVFDNCIGFNIKDSEILGRIDFINNRRFNLNQSGTNFGAISRYKHGYLSNPNASSGLTGIGTTSATLNVNGCGEVILGTGITGPTTITGITGVRAGQLLILKNYQPNHPVTIKSSSDGINGIILNGRKDCVLSTYSDSITFFVSGLGKIVEIGRSIEGEKTVSVKSEVLLDINSYINNYYKFLGREIFNTSTNKFMKALGSSNNSVWTALDGSQTITPV